MIELSPAEARAFLARYHFLPTDVASVFGHLGSVQYDPLNPFGRNHDLVLAARVPDYKVGDWERSAYDQRLIYDAWDKQACLVPVESWPYRSIYHERAREGWEARVLAPHADAVAATLAELRERGALSSLDFTDQTQVKTWQGSWYGTKLVKNILRALWDTGEVVTHHRDKGRHVYDLAERVIPAEIFNHPTPSRSESLRWLIALRHQTMGLLRPNADGALWSVPAKGAERKVLIQELLEEGTLTPVQVGKTRYNMLSTAGGYLEPLPLPPRMRFIAPLDPLLWDRKAVKELFSYDYIWEVYKPEPLRHWGYYVLSVHYRDRFVARFDARLKGKTLHLYKWWWEADVIPDADTLAALTDATRTFLHYLSATGLELPPSLDTPTATALKGAL